jgi:hypothetical protein
MQRMRRDLVLKNGTDSTEPLDGLRGTHTQVTIWKVYYSTPMRNGKEVGVYPFSERNPSLNFVERRQVLAPVI